MSLPKGSRKKDFMRPLWVLGMLLYVYVLGSLLFTPLSCSNLVPRLSQLIGSSLVRLESDSYDVNTNPLT